jgi:hypothetical protein
MHLSKLPNVAGKGHSRWTKETNNEIATSIGLFYCRKVVIVVFSEREERGGTCTCVI